MNQYGVLMDGEEADCAGGIPCSLSNIHGNKRARCLKHSTQMDLQAQVNGKDGNPRKHPQEDKDCGRETK